MSETPNHLIPVTVTETRVYRGVVNAPNSFVALGLVVESLINDRVVKGEGVELYLSEVNRKAVAGEEERQSRMEIVQEH